MEDQGEIPLDEGGNLECNYKEKKPNTREGEVAWLTKDKKGLAIIALDLSDSYIHHIDGCTTTHEAWEHLENVFRAQVRCFKYTLLIKFFTLPLHRGGIHCPHI